jgi:hypothetical protein
MSFMSPKIIAGIFVGPHGAIRNVFLTCCVLLIGTIGMSTWSRWASNVQQYLPASGQRNSEPGGGTKDTSEGEDNDALDGDITTGNEDWGLWSAFLPFIFHKRRSHDKSTPPPAKYPLQILVDDPNANIE